MRTMQRNQQTIYYALYQGETDVYDTDGNKTGEKSSSYSTPVQTSMNVSGSRGTAAAQYFGETNPFTRTAVTNDLDTNFDETTVFWFGKEPGNNIDDYNFVCTGVATTINGRVIALKEVDVTDV